MTPTIETIVARDGHRFEVRRFAASSTARPPMLFLPALGVPAQKYDRFAAAVAAAGRSVAVPEWRGIASSSWRASRHCDWGYASLLGIDLAAVLESLGPAPAVFGGHSLGAQFAAMLAARHPAGCAGLLLVGGGVPYPRAFATPHGAALAVLARLLPVLVRLRGYFPGHRLKFAGREAAGVMRDWAATVRTGRYADYGGGEPMEASLGRTRVPALGLAMRDDWMAPRASLDLLLAKLGGTPRKVHEFDAEELGTTADHFAWLRTPDAVAVRAASAWDVSS